MAPRRPARGAWYLAAVERTLTLIRHGLTDWNEAGRFQGQTDRPLSPAGRRQAERLAARLAPHPAPDAIVASPLRRAADTAAIAFPGAEVTHDPRLMEIHFGAFEGRTREENAALPEWPTWAEDPYLRVAPGGESYEGVRTRVVAWLEELPTDAPHVVAVTHSGAIQMLLAHVLGIERPRWRKRIFVRHSSLTRILVRDGAYVVERVNDTRHLDEAGGDPFWT